MNDPASLLHFCVCCFASEDDGSAGEVVIPGGGHCLNCGAGGSTVHIPRWAIESIRKSAAFVGPRFYPSEENKRHFAEMKRMRTALPIPNTRRAEPVDELGEDGQCRAVKGRYWVHQDEPGNTRTSVTVSAATPHEALQKTKADLPWWPSREVLRGGAK